MWFRDKFNKPKANTLGSTSQAAVNTVNQLDNASVVARIANGFLIMPQRMHGMEGEIYYVQTEREIGEFFIAQSARERMGIGTQQEMFTPSEMSGANPPGFGIAAKSAQFNQTTKGKI